MPTPKPLPVQNAQHHASSDPIFLTLGVVALINVVLSIAELVRQGSMHWRGNTWWLVMSLFFLMHLLTTRRYATANQDRIIRLEERVRYATLLSPAELAAAGALTLPQLIALRFSSDAELPALLSRTLTESLTPKQIKQGIATWRPDYQRV